MSYAERHFVRWQIPVSFDATPRIRDLRSCNLLRSVMTCSGLKFSRHSKSNPIELHQTQFMDWVRLNSAIKRNRTPWKVKKSIEPKRTFDFRTRDLCKTGIENPQPDLGSSNYLSPEYDVRVFGKRRNSAEMASDALWIVIFKCVVKGYRECHFDFKDGEFFKVLKKIGVRGRAFRIANERGQLGHLQCELVIMGWQDCATPIHV